jgi:hypothetical protein
MMRSEEGARPGHISKRSQISNSFQRAIVMLDLLEKGGTHGDSGFGVRSQEGKTKRGCLYRQKTPKSATIIKGQN